MEKSKELVVVCGGRDLLLPAGESNSLEDIARRTSLWSAKLAAELAFIWDANGGYSDLAVVHGGAKGADWLAGQVAKSLGLEVRVYKADWSTHGKAAGAFRNEEMAKVADFCIALPGGTGTADMKARMKKKGKRVHEITPESLPCK